LPHTPTGVAGKGEGAATWTGAGVGAGVEGADGFTSLGLVTVVVARLLGETLVLLEFEVEGGTVGSVNTLVGV